MNNIETTKQARFFYEKGVLLYNGVRTKRALAEMVKCFEKAANLGHAKAMYALCRCYYLGIGVEENMSNSKYWGLKAIEKELPIAKKNLIHIDLQLAHDWCSGNVKAVLDSKKCGCFQCVKIFDASETVIGEYERKEERGTVFCPFCGYDTVIPDVSGYPIKEEFMEGMNEVWFRTGSFVKCKRL